MNELPKVAFIHIPKCGGSSVNNALKEVYPPDKIFHAETPWPDNINEHYNWRDWECIARHILYYKLRAANHFRIVTLLRDPVERQISLLNYLYRRRESENNLEANWNVLLRGAEKNIEEYIDRYIYDNDYAKHLGYDADGKDWEIVVRGMDLLGFVEDYDNFLRKLGNLIQKPLNKHWTNKSEKVFNFLPAQRYHLAYKVKNDLAVYNFAKGLWDENLS